MSGPSLETRFLWHIKAARRHCFDLLVEEAKKVLPPGWVVHLAVGWGLCVYDQDGRTVMSLEVDPPPRLPKGVRPFLRVVADYMHMFGPDNEMLTCKGLEK